MCLKIKNNERYNGELSPHYKIHWNWVFNDKNWKDIFYQYNKKTKQIKAKPLITQESPCKAKTDELETLSTFKSQVNFKKS